MIEILVKLLLVVVTELVPVGVGFLPGYSLSGQAAATEAGQ